jgi:putative transposase
MVYYIPVARGFMYMTAFIDVFSHKIIDWGISNCMSRQWGLGVLNDAIARHGKQEIISSDQGTQYTNFAWIN